MLILTLPFTNQLNLKPLPKQLYRQTVLQKHATVPNTPEPPLPPRTGYGSVTFTSSAPVLANIPKLSTSTNAGLFSMEAINCPYGFLVYTTKLDAAVTAGDLTFKGLKDRAQVFVDGVLQGTSYRVNSAPPVTITAKVGSILTILLENMGRINFSHGMDDEVCSCVRLDTQLFVCACVRSFVRTCVRACVCMRLVFEFLVFG